MLITEMGLDLFGVSRNCLPSDCQSDIAKGIKGIIPAPTSEDVIHGNLMKVGR